MQHTSSSSRQCGTLGTSKHASESPSSSVRRANTMPASAKSSADEDCDRFSSDSAAIGRGDVRRTKYFEGNNRIDRCLAPGNNAMNDDDSDLWDEVGEFDQAATKKVKTEACTECSDSGDETGGVDLSTYLQTQETSVPKGVDADILSEVESAAPSDVKSEASMLALMRYMGFGSTPYMKGPKPKQSLKKTDDVQVRYIHDLEEGDHVIRWKMLGYCYPIQVHGIVFSVGPDFVTIVDCGLETHKLDKVGNFEEQDKKVKKTRERLNIVTLVDEKKIKKWTKIRYGEEVELKVHSSNEEMQQQVSEEDILKDCAKKKNSVDDGESPSAGLEMEEVEKCVQAKIKPSRPKSSKKRNSSSWCWAWSCQSPDGTMDEDVKSKPIVQEEKPRKNSPNLRLPKSDPPMLVLARLRFLLEYGGEPWPPPSSSERDNDSPKSKPRPNLLPPSHLLYANSECIAVFCKTGRWATLQASIFLHSSTVGNVKQTATLAMFLSAQTVTVPASGFWGFFGGTTTVSLFTAQPWLVPALVGGGMVYVGIPTLMLWKAKERWGDTEKKLNHAFWSMSDSDVTVEMIRCYSGLDSS